MTKPIDATPETVHDQQLDLVIDELLGSEPADREGKSARTLVKCPALTVVLTVIRAGHRLHEHPVVGRPEIQKFVGALHGKRAKKGVFLTTGSFSGDARKYVSTIDPKVVLIDGSDLTQLMIDFGLGVSTVNTYDHKRIDLDYSTVPSSQLRRTPRLTTSPRLVLPVALLELQHG